MHKSHITESASSPICDKAADTIAEVSRRRGKPPGKAYVLTGPGRDLLRSEIEKFGIDSFARKMEVNRSTVYRWLSGGTMSTPNLPEICRVLRLPIEKVLAVQSGEDRLRAIYAELVGLSPTAADDLVDYAEHELRRTRSKIERSGWEQDDPEIPTKRRTPLAPRR